MNGQSPYLTRFELDEDEERADGYLYASGRGRAGYAPRNVLQPQQFGYASRPPKGSVGMQIAMGGDHSTSLLLGLEHPTHRPKLPAGASALYNADGTIWKLLPDKSVFDANGKPVNMEDMKGGIWGLTDDLFLKSIGGGGRVFVGPGPNYARVETTDGPSPWLYATV